MWILLYLDLPVIISEEYCGFLDPLKLIWNKRGKKHTLQNLQKLCSEVMLPYDGISGFSLKSSGTTLFRFPLRNKPSDLSDEIQSIKIMRQLLEVLKAEAKYLLLFLRSVCSIEVIEISDSSSSTLFKVSLSSDDHVKKQALLSKVELACSENGSFSSEKKVIQQKLNLSVVIQESINLPTTHTFVVVHKIGSNDADVIALTKKLGNVFPWVSTAFEITNENCNENGRIFCFLPLPVEDKVPFSVHVNGTFAVSRNRRHLKWMAQETQNDSESMWNNILVEKCFPDCYADLIEEVAGMSAKSLEIVAPEKVYSCWPVLSIVKDTQWSGMLKQLFEKFLYSNNVVYTVGGNWVRLTDAVIVVDKSVPDSVQEALVTAKMNVVQLKSDQWDPIRLYVPKQYIKTVTPFLTRCILKKNVDFYKTMTQYNKCCILNYCLSDYEPSEVLDLELVPLAEGSFCKFQRKNASDRIIYICPEDIPHDLLPGHEHQMVNILQNHPDTHYKLMDLALSDQTQLTVLDKHRVADLLKDSFCAWTEEQLEKFWYWIQSKKLDLNDFHNCKIVPVKISQNKTIFLCPNKDSNLVYVSETAMYDEGLMSGLKKLGIMLCFQSDFQYVHHHQLNTCVYQLKPEDVLDALPLKQGIILTASESLAVTNFLLTIKQNIFNNKKRIEKICQLSIFSVVQNHNHYSIGRLQKTGRLKTKLENMAMVKSDNFLFETELVQCQLPLMIKENPSLFMHLTDHVAIIDNIRFIQEIIIPGIREKNFSLNHVTALMISVLKHITTIFDKYPQSKNALVNDLSHLPFVKVIDSAAERHVPSELFNPNDELMKELFKGDPLFPVGEFKVVVNELCLIGLRKPESVTTKELFEVLSNSDNQFYFWKMKAFFKFLNQHTHHLHKQYGRFLKVTFGVTIAEYVKRHRCLPITTNRPSNYPSQLSWKPDGHSIALTALQPSSVVLLPNEVDDQSNRIAPGIIGSQALFVENLPSAVYELLAPRKDDLAIAVVNHFKHVLKNKAGIKPHYLEKISHQTYNFLNNCTCKWNLLDLKPIDAWVWLESSKFIRPELCAFDVNSSLNVILEPFIYILPKQLRKYEAFLCNFGVQKSVTANQIVSILESIRNKSENVASDKAWVIVRCILNWIVKTKVTNFLVPIECEGSYPDLHPAGEVSYTDNDLLLEIAKSSDDNCKIIHHSVSTNVAYQLNLTPLSDRLDITEEIFSDAGQGETLITRLSNILEEYKNGITILKEMIQNADDAEATEVNILYDTRNHTTEPLLFKGMAGSHGPGLVVHNDATFTEQDFANITKLAGATKRDKPLKIGKFGIGFCSVYHITDIPSFVSGEWLYIFDPTLSYLKGVIKNESQPGKRIKYTYPSIANTEQLAPYKHIFGFNPSGAYTGTMFRFPFRRNASRISSTIYDKKMMNELSTSLMKEGKSLLLFLNNVKKITYHFIQDGDNIPVKLFDIENVECDDNISRIRTTSYPKCKIQDDHYYLISKSSLESHISAVGCQLSYSNEKYRVKPVEYGQVFCYLPLSSYFTGLPVHIHANFAVKKDRSAICTASSSDIGDEQKEEHWNKTLLETVIPDAYCKLLHRLKILHQQNKLDGYVFYILWPLERKLQIKAQWMNLLSHLYPKIVKENLFYSSFVNKWRKFKESQFLDESMLFSQNNIKCIVRALDVLKLPIVYLPEIYTKELEKHGVLFMKLHEFVEAFLKRLHLFTNHVDLRDKVLFQLLRAYDNEVIEEKSSIRDLFKSYPCIPCTPDGVLKKCCDIVDPKSKLSKLFTAEDSMFPIPFFSKDDNIRRSMSHLGMLKYALPWDVLLSCARKVKHFYRIKEEETVEKINTIIACAEKNIKLEKKINRKCLDEFKNTRFLPVLKKPNDYALTWKGENCSVCSPLEVTHVNNIETVPFIIGSQRIILNTGTNGCKQLDYKTLEFFNISNIPKVEDVIKNYEVLITSYLSIPFERVEKVVILTYEFLNLELRKQSSFFLDKIPSTKIGKQLSVFKSKRFIWINGNFIRPKDVADDWIKDSRYLYKIPDVLVPLKFLKFALGIKESFTATQLINTFMKMMDEFEDGEISDDCKQIVNRIVEQLNRYTKDDFDDLDNKKDICLPSEKYTLHPIDSLSYNDAPWLKPDQTCIFIHRTFNRQTALDLGVQPHRDKFLDSFTSDDNFESIPFGQREKLPQRIRNILRDYPLDITLIKELLQNADDAKATKMYVILDKREHGKKKVLSDQWKELQGPALLVWNDQEFSDDDLKGIQSLGIGSKRDDYDSIGQFGIGFNVVYHLTDCPCLLTRGKLCVFDPRCYFVPHATELQPGRCYNANKKFWKNFSDIQSTFLLNHSLSNKPEGLDKGSMFRFPLRKVDSELFEEVLSKEDMEEHLDTWATEIKEALLFLNHICCFKVFVIDNETARFVTKVSYEVKADRNNFHQKMKQLNDDPDQMLRPFRVTYPLTINVAKQIDGSHSPSRYSEKWLIQQGYKDVHLVCDQTWPSIGKVFPKHGLAAPLALSDNGNSFVGKIFCFLPLPGQSGLPVHINGQFFLDSNRRSIWKGDNNSSDERKEWNDKIIQAICSSYVEFILEVKSTFVKIGIYLTENELKQDCNRYYSLFPYWIDESSEKEINMTEECKDLARLFFEKISAESDNNILACVTKYQTNFVIRWHCLVDEADQFQQAHFYALIEISPILKKIGMKMTLAPMQLYDHLKKFFRPPIVAKLSVFDFYTKFQDRIFKNGIPCDISRSPFRTAKNFSKFLNYVTENKRNTENQKFVKPPLNHPLLLTADNFIRPFATVLSSKFHHLFQASQSMFLHECCFDLKLDPALFKFDQEVEFGKIEVLMKSNFSNDLLEPIVAKTAIPDEDLQTLWECISSDPFFFYYRSQMVKKWALLPATNSYLYSSKSKIIPIDCSDDNQSWCELLVTFGKVGVPILRHDAAELAKQYCPKLAEDFGSVLSVMYEIQHKDAAFTNSQIDSEDADQILKYLSRCNFKCGALLHQVKSLPLFTTVVGNLTSLLEKNVYIWPESFCDIAYEKWAPQDSVVFLQPDGSWTRLCESNSSSLLSTKTTPEDVYIDLIFKVFDTFTNEEIKSHMLYIRNEIYPACLHLSDSPNLSESEKAKQFLNCLSELKFLEHSSELLPINRFCDHKVEIFSMFPDKFIFLNEEYRDECWLPFFRSIKLQTQVSCEEFIEFCNIISTGQHKDMLKASEVLLKYLFSKKAMKWFKNQTFFNTLKKINFIPVNRLDRLSWIKEPIQSRSFFPKLGIHLTCFSESASEEIAQLIWTVKPVITLPKMTKTKLEVIQELKVYEKLEFTTLPSLNDVYQNIVNISETRLANFELFNKYDIRTNPDINVYELMASNLRCVAASSLILKKLKNIPCIPVHAGHSTNQPVLVSSHQVVRYMNDADKGLVPYISCLPSSFNFSTISHVTKIMEVNEVISLRNIQFVLEFAYERFTDQTMNPNDLIMLKQCIIKLHELMQREDKRTIAETLSPLYLPSAENSVLPVSSLLFHDCNRYRRHAANITLRNRKTSYRFFHIPFLSANSNDNFSEKYFCLKLPKALRPKGISLVCIEKIANPNEVIGPVDEEHPLHQHFHSLKKNLTTEKPSMQLIFEKVLRMKHPHDEIQIRNFLKFFKCIAHDLQVVQIRSLHLALFVDDIEVGTFPTRYILERKDTSNTYVLYVDSNASSFGEATWKDLSFSFCIEIARVSNSALTSFLRFKDILCHFLKVRSNEDLQQILEEFEMTDIQPVEWDEYVCDEVKLGLRISSKWLPSLANGFDDDIIFRTQEWVGYELEENKYVWAMILYPVHIESGENTNPLSKKYKIIISSDDEEGITVSVLDIYKVITTKKKRETQAAEQRLVPMNDIQASREVRNIIENQKLSELKKKINNELEKIWMLSEEEKRKALRRMCYTYHPDKAEPKNVQVYEEAFKFLQSQIDHLESSGQSPHPSRWRNYCDDLNENIRKTSQQQAYDEDLDSRLPETKRNLVEAKRWFRQAESDHEAMNVLNRAVDNGNAMICCQVLFMAHEVMEKGLKATVYALVGLGEYFLKIHDLTPLARAIHSEDKSAARLITIVSGMENYYLDTRFPNRFNCPTAPIDRFGPQEAVRIAKSANEAFEIIRNIVNKEHT